jgi:hypothetical protein
MQHFFASSSVVLPVCHIAHRPPFALSGEPRFRCRYAPNCHTIRFDRDKPRGADADRARPGRWSLTSSLALTGTRFHSPGEKAAISVAASIPVSADSVPGHATDAVGPDDMHVALTRQLWSLSYHSKICALSRNRTTRRTAILSRVEDEAAPRWQADGRPACILRKDIAHDLDIDLTAAPWASRVAVQPSAPAELPGLDRSVQESVLSWFDVVESRGKSSSCRDLGLSDRTPGGAFRYPRRTK